jgi:predicted permease
LSFLLIVGAGLLLQSMQRIRRSSPGFAADKILTTGIDLLSAGYDKARAAHFQDRLIERVRAMPGVDSAAYSRIRPFSLRTYSAAAVTVDGYRPGGDEQPAVEYNEVSPSYFATMGIPLVSGREFERSDDSSGLAVAVIDETMAARYWPGRDPIGRTFQSNGRPARVVGVARAARYRSLLEVPRPFFYVPLLQNPSTTANLAVRTFRDAASLATDLLREIRELDGNLALAELITMREQVARSTAAQRIAVTLLGAFGVLALLLAAVGLYGVMSHAVSQSSRELGLRMALGAGAPDLLRLVLSRGFRLTAGGIALGVAAALALTRLLGYLLYEVSPRDPIAFAAAFGVMTMAAFAACLLPAWRAARTDPARALRG